MKKAVCSCMAVLMIWFPIAGSSGLAWSGTRSIYDLSLKELPDVVITDTKIAQPLEAVTQRVEVLTADQLDSIASPNRNLAELLSYHAGLFVNVLSRNDANWGSYGGLGPKYNSYLLDGLPMDSFIDSMSIDPMALERIEMHKGPASVMYSNYLSMDFAGNETPLAGITNFILKNRIESDMTRMQLGGGSYSTDSARFYHQGHRGSLHYFFGTSYEQSIYTDYGTPNSWLNMKDNPDYLKTKLYAKLLYAFERNDAQASLFIHHTQHTGDAGRPNRDFGNQYDTINLDYNRQMGDATNLRLKTGYRGYNRRWAEDNFPTDLALREHDGVTQRIFPTDLTITWRHAGDNILTIGIDDQKAVYNTYAETNGIEATGNDVTSRSTGFFLQEKLIIGSWVYRVGGRYNRTTDSYRLISGTTPDVTEKSWDKFLWSAGIRYNISPALALYANSGTSFVVPSAKSVGGTLTASDLGVLGKDGQLPNPGLKPESGIASDLGIDHHPNDTLVVGIRAFLNKVSDAIVENAVSATPSQSRSVNAGTAASSGVEISIQKTFFDSFRLFANDTITSTTVKDSLNADQDGSNIPFVPDSVANIGAHVQFPFGLTLTPVVHMTGKYYDSTSKTGRKQFGPYTVLNCRAQQRIAKQTEHEITATLDLNNVTDKRYEMPWQFRDPGFNLFAGLEVIF